MNQIKWEDMLKAYELLADDYYNWAYHFYEVWESRTPKEKVIIPSSDKAVLEKVIHLHAMQIVKEHDEIRPVPMRGNSYTLEYCYTWDYESGTFFYDSLGDICDEEDEVLLLYYFSIQFNRLSWIYGNYKKTYKEFNDPKVGFPFWEIENVKDMIIHVGSYILGKTHGKTASGKPGGQEKKRRAEERKKSVLKEALKHGKIKEGFFKILKSDWEESCKIANETTYNPSQPTMNKWKSYITKELRKKYGKKISVKLIK
ncbi:hypothetical protein ACFLZQ_08585 [Thermodesulfobacteriota bacterium]